MMSCRLSCCGFHPSSRRIFSDEATSRAESPARRADSITGFDDRSLCARSRSLRAPNSRCRCRGCKSICLFLQTRSMPANAPRLNPRYECNLGCMCHRESNSPCRRWIPINVHRVRHATPTESNAFRLMRFTASGQCAASVEVTQCREMQSVDLAIPF